jgi:hypothetical protein
MNREELEWIQFLKPPFHYDANGGFIMDDHGNPVAEVRGWGLLQYEENPDQLQDKMGRSIAEGLNRIVADERTASQQVPHQGTTVGPQIIDLQAEVERLRWEREAPQIDYRQFVKDYWCLLNTDMDKLDSIELTVTPHQLVAMLKEYAKGGENYVPEASNTDSALVVTPHSSSGNAVEQVPRTGRIHYGGYAQNIIHYVIADDTKELIKISAISKKIAAVIMAEKQKQKKAQGYDGPFGLPHHCFSFNEAVSFTVDEAGEAVIIF